MIFKSLVPSVTLDNVSDYLSDIIDYYDKFKVFTTPFETTLYAEPPYLESVDRIYDAYIEDEDITGDSLYNVSFRFVGVDGVLYYAYAHMRINYGYDIEEFIRGTMFVTKRVRLFFMTTMPSIEETDDLHGFLLEDGIDLCFDEPLAALANSYALQINTP